MHEYKHELIEGADRNNPDLVKSHLYAHVDGELVPMCEYGWNRSDGEGFSILRGRSSRKGACQLCADNVNKGKAPVFGGFPHKTKWL